MTIRPKYIKPDVDIAVTNLERFQELRNKHWTKMKVQWSCMANAGEPTIAVYCFENKSGIKGKGRLAMTEICKMADHMAAPLRLWTNVPKLDAYYESFGFKSSTKRFADETRWFKREPLKLATGA